MVVATTNTRTDRLRIAGASSRRFGPTGDAARLRVLVAVLVFGCGAALIATAVRTPQLVRRAEPRTLYAASARSASRLAPPGPSLEARCAQTASRIRRRLDGRGSVIAAAPFVLGGDRDASELRRLYHQTVQPAVRAMMGSYFRCPPSAPVTILVFSGSTAYRRYARLLFLDRDVSRFGYYKPGRRAIVVDSSWGDGPLLHELTHALMACDYPDAPPWLQEGLAALHESSHWSKSEGRAVLEGEPNWRGAVVKRDIQQGRMAGLWELTRLSSLGGDREASYYAQARHVCLFLQQSGLLERCYRRCRDRREEDPHGERTLLALFPGRDREALDEEFRRWAETFCNP